MDCQSLRFPALTPTWNTVSNSTDFVSLFHYQHCAKQETAAHALDRTAYASRPTLATSMQSHGISECDVAVSTANVQACGHPQSSTSKLSRNGSSGSLSSISPQHAKSLGHQVRSGGLDQALSSRDTINRATDACCSCQKNEAKSSSECLAAHPCINCVSTCYEVDESLNRIETLEDESQEANRQSDDISLLIATLRWGTESTAKSVLAGLRLGVSTPDLAQAVRAEFMHADSGHT